MFVVVGTRVGLLENHKAAYKGWMAWMFTILYRDEKKYIKYKKNIRSNSINNFSKGSQIWWYFFVILGTNVVRVSAVDNDGDQIYYELGTEAQSRFKINLVTGQITSNVVIDREVR